MELNGKVVKRKAVRGVLFRVSLVVCGRGHGGRGSIRTSHNSFHWPVFAACEDSADISPWGRENHASFAYCECGKS
jgi:hypothetical protein